MELNPEVVAAYKKLLTDPAAHGLPVLPMAQVLQPSEEATPAHKLHADYLAYIQSILHHADIPKVIFYIIMDEMHFASKAKAPSGEMGYRFTVSPAPATNQAS